MVVKDPPPKSAFNLRAMPATIFGPCEAVSGASWTYQNGLVKARTNIQPQGLTDDDLNWVKVHMSEWDAPDAPLPLPEPELYDARAVAPVAPIPDGATRDTATCTACICFRRKKKAQRPHSLIWGECLKATPPPPVIAGPPAEVVPLIEIVEPIVEEEELEGLEEEAIASASRYRQLPASPTKLLEFPHACLAFSDAATWGSHASSYDTATDAPSTSDELSAVGEEQSSGDFDDEFDDDFAIYGGPQVSVVEPIPTLTSEEIALHVDTAEVEPCEADAEVEEEPPPRRHRSRKKRWFRNMLRTNPWLVDVVASITVPDIPAKVGRSTEEEPHAEMADIDAM